MMNTKTSFFLEILTYRQHPNITNCFLARRAVFFFLKALISERYVMLLAGRWWKLAYDQLHGDNRTKAQSAQAFGKDFRS